MTAQAQPAENIADTNPAMTDAIISCMECSIYVASLVDYNSGVHHGRWIDCLNDPDEVRDQIAAMLAESPTARRYGETAEEWAIHADGGWHGLHINESEDLDALCELAETLGEHGEALAEYLDHLGTRDASGFEDAYCGTYDSELDYAYELADELIPHDAPDFLTRYFDYEAFSRDLFMSDNFSVRVSGGVAIFRNI